MRGYNSADDECFSDSEQICRLLLIRYRVFSNRSTEGTDARHVAMLASRCGARFARAGSVIGADNLKRRPVFLCVR